MVLSVFLAAWCADKRNRNHVPCLVAKVDLRNKHMWTSGHYQSVWDSDFVIHESIAAGMTRMS